MVPGKNCPWWLESDDGGGAEFGCGPGCSGAGDVTVGETPATDSMAAPQWRQNRLSRATSREQVGHLTMRGMLPEYAEKIDNLLKLTDSAHDRGDHRLSGTPSADSPVFAEIQCALADELPVAHRRERTERAFSTRPA